MVASKTEDYQLLGDVLEQGLKELGYSREDLNVELFASDRQHVLDLYCSKGKDCCYQFYWPSFGMAYGNPRFSELGMVLTVVTLKRSRMVLGSHDWGAHGGNKYWRTLLGKLTLTSIHLRSPLTELTNYCPCVMRSGSDTFYGFVTPVVAVPEYLCSNLLLVVIWFFPWKQPKCTLIWWVKLQFVCLVFGGTVMGPPPSNDPLVIVVGSISWLC